MNKIWINNGLVIMPFNIIIWKKPVARSFKKKESNTNHQKGNLKIFKRNWEDIYNFMSITLSIWMKLINSSNYTTDQILRQEDIEILSLLKRLNQLLKCYLQSSWAQRLSVSPISLITGSSLHSASIGSQGHIQAVANWGREGMCNQGETVKWNNSAALGQGLGYTKIFCRY